MLFALVFFAASVTAEDFPDVETSTRELKVLARDAETECRGGYPSDARVLAGCVTRDLYSDILEYRGICNEGPFIEDDNWVKCRK